MLLYERMRIDNSGNVLVGKSVFGVATAGHALMANGQQRATVDGDIAAIHNRLSSDGDIVQFRKDSTTVGSIGTAGGEFFIASDGTTDAGLRFRDSGDIIPALSSGAGSNGQSSLGQAGFRFKDLYLSGGVYLGGTGAANKLEDYEEGTWTPVYEPSAGAFGAPSYNMQVGRYVKVGNMVMVTCQIRINTFSVGTASGTLRITGLPFRLTN